MLVSWSARDGFVKCTDHGRVSEDGLSSVQAKLLISLHNRDVHGKRSDKMDSYIEHLRSYLSAVN